ncbi:MAG: COG4315 family predicted lipoprotein [Solirubrobacterales bacterium]
MPLHSISRPRHHPIRIALLTAAALALSLATGVYAMQPSKVVAKEADNATLGRTVLTTTKGRTLYSLSVETHGKFICTGSCLASWKPLVVPAGVTPKGPVKLGTIKRPDGRTQVTFKGHPLYSFNGDVKPGETNGEGLKDVGTWHAARVAKTSAPPAPEPESPYPY